MTIRLPNVTRTRKDWLKDGQTHLHVEGPGYTANISADRTCEILERGERRDSQDAATRYLLRHQDLLAAAARLLQERGWTPPAKRTEKANDSSWTARRVWPKQEKEEEAEWTRHNVQDTLDELAQAEEQAIDPEDWNDFDYHQ